MKDKIISLIRYYSFIIFPLLTIIICLLINFFKEIFDIDNEKIQVLVSISASFIGVLLTILTIYLAVPKKESQLKKFRESHHEKIYIRNIITGIILFFISILVWILGNDNCASSIAFLAGITNITISMYYTFSLINLL